MIIFAVAAVIGFVAAAPPTYFGIREEPMEEEEEIGCGGNALWVSPRKERVVKREGDIAKRNGWRLAS